MERILTMHGGDSSGVRLRAYVATAYSQYYPNVAFDDAVSAETRDIARQMADLSQFDPNDIPTLQALTEQLGGTSVLADPAAGALGERLRENARTAPLAVPLLIAQGLTDIVINPSVNDAYVEERCAAGQDIEYWRIPERDHGGIVAPDSPIGEPLIHWTRDRFAVPASAMGWQEERLGRCRDGVINDTGRIQTRLSAHRPLHGLAEDAIVQGERQGCGPRETTPLVGVIV